MPPVRDLSIQAGLCLPSGRTLGIGLLKGHMVMPTIRKNNVSTNGFLIRTIETFKIFIQVNIKYMYIILLYKIPK